MRIEVAFQVQQQMQLLRNQMAPSADAAALAAVNPAVTHGQFLATKTAEAQALLDIRQGLLDIRPGSCQGS